MSEGFNSTYFQNKSHWFLIFWVAISLLAPIIANEKPLIAKNESGYFFPYLSDQAFSESNSTILLAPVNYNPNTIDYKHSNFVSPFDDQDISKWQKRHWLGTDRLGRDVLSNLIYGSRTALLVGLGAMLLAALIGILLGSIAAYFGDEGISLPLSSIILQFLLILFFIFFQVLIIPWRITTVDLSFKIGLSGLAAVIFVFLAFLISKKSNHSKSKTYFIPIDLIISRCIEIMESIPLLFLLIALSTIIQPSIGAVVLIIGLSSWANIARYTRAEVLKVKQLNYIESTSALGYSSFHQIRKHILPNAIQPVLITIAFGVSAAILIESTLSFLGLGVDTNTASWGKLIAQARTNYEAWWLTLFPGLAIFLTVLNCNRFAQQFRKDF